MNTVWKELKIHFTSDTFSNAFTHTLINQFHWHNIQTVLNLRI